MWDLSSLCSCEIIGDWTLPLDLSQVLRLEFSLFMWDHWGLTLPLDLSQNVRLDFSLFIWDHWGLTLPLDLSQNVRLELSLFMWDHWGLTLPLDLSQNVRLDFSLFMWDHWGLTLPLDLSQNVRREFSLFMWDHWGLSLAIRSLTGQAEIDAPVSFGRPMTHQWTFFFNKSTTPCLNSVHAAGVCPVRCFSYNSNVFFVSWYYHHNRHHFPSNLAGEVQAIF